MTKTDKQFENFLVAFFCLMIAIVASLCEWVSHPLRGFRIIVPLTPDELRDLD